MRVAAKAGDRNNRLTLVSLHEKSRGGYRWIASCDCGNETIVVVRDFRSGHTKSCGCLRREVMTAAKTTHGMSESAEFRVWCHMLGRCFNPTDSKYPYYGERGITVCDRWLTFANFYSDMGDRPTQHHSIDRKEVNGNYEPDNCRWATPIEQAQNKRNNVLVFVDGERMVIAEAERRLNLGKGSITQKVSGGLHDHQQATDHFTRRYHELHVRTFPA